MVRFSIYLDCAADKICVHICEAVKLRMIPGFLDQITKWMGKLWEEKVWGRLGTPD